jgi:hypothetical protein
MNTNTLVVQMNTIINTNLQAVVNNAGYQGTYTNAVKTLDDSIVKLLADTDKYNNKFTVSLANDIKTIKGYMTTIKSYQYNTSKTIISTTISQLKNALIQFQTNITNLIVKDHPEAISEVFATVKTNIAAVISAIGSSAKFPTAIQTLKDSINQLFISADVYNSTFTKTFAKDISAINGYMTTLSGYSYNTNSNTITNTSNQLSQAIIQFQANMDDAIVSKLSSQLSSTQMQLQANMDAAAAAAAIAARAAIPIHSINDQIDLSNNGYILIAPLKFNTIDSNVYMATGIYYDNNIPNYNPNGQYKFSASSYSDASHQVYNVFNGGTTKSWQCNTKNSSLLLNNTGGAGTKYTQDPYTGSAPSAYTGGGSISTKYSTNLIGQSKGVAGEWIQIDLPYSIYLTKYSLLTPTMPIDVSNSPNPNKYTFPRILYLLGSNDKTEIVSNWNICQICYLTADNLQPILCNGVAVDPIKYSNSNYSPLHAYSKYRLVINQAADNISTVAITQWNLWGTMNNQESFTNLSTSYINRNMNPNTNSGLAYFNIDDRRNQYSLANSTDSILLLNSMTKKNSNVVTTDHIVEGFTDDDVATWGNTYAYTRLAATMNDNGNNDIYDICANTLKIKNTMYTIDSNGIYTPSTIPPTLADGMKQDVILAETQQTMIIALGGVCLCTLLILAISIAID